MANPTYPGIHDQEVATGAQPIEAACTSTTSFAGIGEIVPDDEAFCITKGIEYQRINGSLNGGAAD